MDVPRDKYGRPLVRLESGSGLEACTRPTTVADTLDDQHALSRWSERRLARGLALRPDLHALVAATADEDAHELDTLCARAKDAAAARAGANTGSALHYFTAQLDRGEDVTAPPPLDAAVELYARTLADAEVHVVPGMVEHFVILTGESEPIAGSLDRIVEIRGQHHIADLKTGASLNFAWLSISIQLAIYARAQHFYDPDTETLSPKPDVDLERALVVHLRPDPLTCELRWVRIGDDAGWGHTQQALSVRAARRDLTEPFADADVIPRRRAWLVGRVTRLVTDYPDVAAVLAQRWPVGVPTFKSSDMHTAQQLAAIQCVVVQVEGEAELPFDDPDPTVLLSRGGRGRRTPKEKRSSAQTN
jgi:hypothetical protein